MAKPSKAKPTKSTLNRAFRGIPNKRLEASANRILGKGGYFARKERDQWDAWDADQIGQNGRLKATWIGRP
jgi:hypothetical protein